MCDFFLFFVHCTNKKHKQNTKKNKIAVSVRAYYEECLLAPERRKHLENRFGKDVTTVILQFTPILDENTMPRDKYVWETKPQITNDKNTNINCHQSQI